MPPWLDWSFGSGPPYILPNSDFFRIKAMAENFMGGQILRDFKQMPLVPLLIEPVALLLPVADNAYLHASMS